MVKPITLAEANKRVKTSNYIFDDNFINSTTQCDCICLTCHNIWKTKPCYVFRGRGCPICYPRKLTKEKANEKIKHRNYIFQNNYIDTTKKCTCLCLSCKNTWSVIPNNIFQGNGCPICHKERIKLSYSEVFNRGLENNFVICGDYSSSKQPCTIYHLSCGKSSIFEPRLIWNSDGLKTCLHCRSSQLSTPINKVKIRVSKQGFTIHNDYSSLHKKCTVTHNKCSYQWKVIPYSIINSLTGCPKCTNKQLSKGEQQIIKILNDLDINYIYQWKGLYNKFCINPETNRQLRYDFYLPSYNLVIEFNGIQHYEFNHHWHRTNEVFQASQQRDKYKIEYLNTHSISMEIIKYNENIIERLEEILQEN